MLNIRRVIRLFIACSVVLLLATACGDDDAEGENNENNEAENTNQEEPVEEPPEDPEELCEAACGAIYDEDGCDDFFVYEEGGAMPETECVDRCLNDNKFRGGEWCVATEAECTDDPYDMIEPCLPDDYHHPHCSDLGLWPREWEEMEERAVELVNEHRTDGLECDGEQLDSVDPVEMDDALRCAARLHSKDMVDSEYFSTTNPETGENTSDRIEAAGYAAGKVSGVVTSGELTAEQLVQGWATDSERCQTIMDEEFEHIGIGRYEFERWTLKLASQE